MTGLKLRLVAAAVSLGGLVVGVLAGLVLHELFFTGWSTFGDGGLTTREGFRTYFGNLLVIAALGAFGAYAGWHQALEHWELRPPRREW